MRMSMDEKISSSNLDSIVSWASYKIGIGQGAAAVTTNSGGSKSEIATDKRNSSGSERSKDTTSDAIGSGASAFISTGSDSGSGFLSQNLKSTAYRALYENDEDIMKTFRLGHNFNSSVREREHKNVEDEVTKFGLQWMRPHPALLHQSIAMAKAKSNMDTDVFASIATDASELVNRYALKNRRKRKLGDMKMDMNTKDRDIDRNNHQHGSLSSQVLLPTAIPGLDSNSTSKKAIPNGLNLFSAPSVKIDLTQLIDPPLHSEWLPGQDMSIHYGNDDIESTGIGIVDGYHSKAQCTSEIAGFETMKSISRDYDKIKQTFLHVMENDHPWKVKDSHSTNSGGNLDLDRMKKKHLLKNVSDLSLGEWIKILPSHEFLQRIKKLKVQNSVASKDTKESEGKDIDTKAVHVNVSVLEYAEIFHRMVSICPTRSLGMYILSILLPTLMDDMGDLDWGIGTVTNNENVHVHEHHTTRIQQQMRMSVSKIAILLVRQCSLGTLTKGELSNELECMKNNDVSIELKRCITEEYFKFNMR